MVKIGKGSDLHIQLRMFFGKHLPLLERMDVKAENTSKASCNCTSEMFTGQVF